MAFIYAGNDLLSHTLGACSNIGPAGLNFRVRDGNGWIPRGKITDKAKQLLAIGFWPLAMPCLPRSSCSTQPTTAASLFLSTFAHQPEPSEAEPRANSQERLLKDPEANTSQLNRLDGLTFFFAYFPISAVLRRLCFPSRKHRREASAELLTSAQVLARS